MSILKVEDLYKTFGEKILFDHISFSIEAKDRIGLIGVNGTGKSTLLKVIAGVEGHEGGDFFHANDFVIEYLPQEPQLNEELTVLEQVFFGEAKIMKVMRQYEAALIELEQDPLDKAAQNKLLSMQEQMDELEAWDANTVAKTILTKLGITEFAKKVKLLSGGQKKRVAIAKALIQPVDLLLLDEPTNHLDNEMIQWLEQFLMQYKGAILLVTHDRYFLNRVTNRMFELAEGKLYEYEGNYEYYLEKKVEREEMAVQKEAKRQNLLRRELAWLKRGARARTTKQKARVQRVEKLQNEKTAAEKRELDFSIGSTRLGKNVIELINVKKQFASRTLFQHVDLLITPTERLGIVGANGVGKTTLLQILAGKEQPDEGEVKIGETVKIGYYAQKHKELDDNLRMIDYIKEQAELVHTVDGRTITAEQMLERFLFPRSVQRTHIRRLSGGERKRLYLLKVLMEEPNVLILDEPTNDLDTETLTVLEDYLDQFPGVVITVSHDRYFLDRVVDRLLIFSENGDITPYLGSYSEWLEEIEEKDSRKEGKGKGDEIKPIKVEKKEKRKKLSYKEKLEWEGIEEKITSLEERIGQLEESIVEAGSDIDRIRDMYEEQKKLEQELEEAMARWEELALIVEEINNQ